MGLENDIEDIAKVMESNEQCCRTILYNWLKTDADQTCLNEVLQGVDIISENKKQEIKEILKW